MNKNKFFNIQMMVEGGIVIALSLILSFIKLGKMPQGGSITLASMFPIILYSIRWGAPRGMVIGGLYGVVSLLIDPQIYYPVQVILDYPLPFAFIGLSGLSFSKDVKDIKGYLPAVILAHLLRTIAHVLSGVIFFADYAPEGMNPWIYSITYNLSYMLPEMILSIFFLFILWKRVSSLIVRQY